MVGKSPCRLMTAVKFPWGSRSFRAAATRSEPEREGGIGGHGIAAMAADDIGNFILGGGHQNLADIGFNRPLPDMDDHGDAHEYRPGVFPAGARKPCGRGSRLWYY